MGLAMNMACNICIIILNTSHRIELGRYASLDFLNIPGDGWWWRISTEASREGYL